jgi:hypothetical protein
MISHSMMRTSRPPSLDRNEPSWKRRRTGGLRAADRRARNVAPVPVTWARKALEAKPAVQQHDHAVVQGAHQAPAMAGFPAGAWAERGGDDGSGAAGNQGGQQDLRVAGSGGVLVRSIAQRCPQRGIVGYVKVGAVDRHHQQARPTCPGRAYSAGRSPQHVEQGPQRAHSESGAGMPQRGRGHLRHWQSAQGAGELGPHSRVAALGEQPSGQQQVDHHPGRQLAQPLLHSPALGKDRVDHLERHDLRQLAQMARGEDTLGYCDLAGDDTLARQRSLRFL